ncbi:MAG TPA: cytochrome bc complex cytochrome b subunit [Thermoflexales bacterium]|nr:cytochrome bc complex cytochrome b subunit [Thermoflexales bacterium]HQW33934.1 cytochrome bc complex cytochrome b subunit [Thermoflexales bacterium]HQZ21244.1 cytochrome bc complex cytochrome b subunit [Thermoflexales bacterium]HRA00485.1 cytochrome bc complex cytochrome b subunit [Thermoflexales bacterium]
MSKVGQWIDKRTGISGPVRSFLNYPVPKYVHNNLLYTLGGLTAISFGLQVITGIMLTFYFDPSTEGAYNSVDYITYTLPLGWLVRGLHHYGASAMVILVALHMLRTYFFSAYKKPREINWLTGVLLLFLTLAFGFTGYLLPWDQKGYWATRVGTSIAGSVPLIGATIANIMRGGAELGQSTLTRFFATHVMLLPATLALLIGVHIFQLRYHGMAPAITEKAKAQSKSFVPFFPYWVVNDAIAGLGLLALLVYISATQRAPLEFPADPTSSNFIPRPEWYFLFYYQILKYFPGGLEPVATVLIPLFIFGSMILLPFIDRGEERRPWKKPVTTIAAIFYIVVIIIFTVLAG